MTYSKTFNIAGGIAQLIGLALLTSVDLAQVRLAEAQDKIRPTQLTEVFDAALRDQQYEHSTQEVEVQQLQASGRNHGLWFRIGLVVVVVGTALQFVGTLLSD